MLLSNINIKIWKCCMKLTIFHIASPFFTIKSSYNGLSATFKVLVHKDRSLWHLNGPPLGLISWYQAIQTALTPSYCMLTGEATNTDLIVFSFTRLTLESAVYHTQGKQCSSLHQYGSRWIGEGDVLVVVVW